MSTATTNVLVFSHRAEVREAIINAVGRRPAPDLDRLHYVEAGTVADVLSEVDAGKVDLLILDGEAQPRLPKRRSEDIETIPGSDGDAKRARVEV